MLFLYAGAALFFYFGVKYIISGMKTYSKSKTLARAPIVPLNRMSAGLVHARGKATGDDQLTSPLTKVPCCYYQFQVTKHNFAAQPGQPEWIVVGKGTEQRPFYLDDGTARVVVNPQGAEYEVPETFRFRTGKQSTFFVHPMLGIKGPSNEDLKAFFEPRWGKGKYQFSEYCLPAERDCSVLGQCAENPNQPQDPKYASNHTLLKGAKEQPFLISSESSEEEQKNLRKKAVTAIATGVACILFAVLCGVIAAGNYIG